MLENRNDLLEIKKAEIISIIERTNISLRGEEKISSRDIMQSLLKSMVIRVLYLKKTLLLKFF